jgi:hypothetical protein
MKVITLASLLTLGCPVYAEIVTDLSDFNSKITVSGTQVVPGVLSAAMGYSCTRSSPGSPTMCISVYYDGTMNGYPQRIEHVYYGELDVLCPESVSRYWPSGAAVLQATDQEAARAAYEVWINSKLPTVLTLRSTPVPTGFVVQKTTISGLSSACKLPKFLPNGVGYNVGGSSTIIVNPPEGNPSSICSLNSQNLNIVFTSDSLAVNGLTKSTNLDVTCTAGDGKNYILKLTGNNVNNGRLNFGNGVFAQVSLNGTQVAANGAGITLNSLASKSMPVSASLVGTASVPGVSNATGVLVLEAL